MTLSFLFTIEIKQVFRIILIKIRLKQFILNDTIFLEFTFCKCFRYLRRYDSYIIQQIILIELQKSIQFLRPILHRHRDMALRLLFRIIQIHGNYPVQPTHFLFSEIIFSNRYITFYNFTVRCIFPCGQSHIILTPIRTTHNQLSRRMAMNGKMQLVLNVGKKIKRHLGFCIIIKCCCINISYLLIKQTFTGTYFPNFFKQTIENPMACLNLFYVFAGGFPGRNPACTLHAPYIISTRE